MDAREGTPASKTGFKSLAPTILRRPMELNENAEPASRSGICPECGRRMRALADEPLECPVCGAGENDGEEEEEEET